MEEIVIDDYSEQKEKNKKFKKKYIIFGIIYILILFLIIYFKLPFFNFRSRDFYLIFTLIIIGPATFAYVLINKSLEKKNNKQTYTKIKFDRKKGKIIKEKKDINEKYKLKNLIGSGIFYTILTIVLVVLIGSLSGAKIFNAKVYAKQLTIINGNEEDLNTIFNYEEGHLLLPNIDKDLAFVTASQKLEELGSQYSIDYDNFTLISVERNGKTELIRVTPLEYSTPFVALSQKNKGTAGYIEVNVVTNQAVLVKYPEGEGLKYMPTGVFDKDLDRHVRSKYPTVMYENKFFEIDNDGNPYWVIPTIKKEIGLFDGADVNGFITVNARTGECNKYKLNDSNVPSWVQRAVDDEIIAEQANNALTYKNGFFNTLFTKKEVFQLSDGYNYFIRNGNTYYVSCITSPNLSDETSIGFLIMNLKTKECTRYYSSGLTEMLARKIAQDDERVKEKQLDSTWPILITYHGVPTYFIVLKNDYQPQKTVLISVKDGTIVAIGDNLEEAKMEYEKILAEKGIIESSKVQEVTVTVDRINVIGDKKQFSVIADENLPFDANNVYFEVSSNLNNASRFLQSQDKIKITYKEYADYILVLSIELVE